MRVLSGGRAPEVTWAEPRRGALPLVITQRVSTRLHGTQVTNTVGGVRLLLCLPWPLPSLSGSLIAVGRFGACTEHTERSS